MSPSTPSIITTSRYAEQGYTSPPRPSSSLTLLPDMFGLPLTRFPTPTFGGPAFGQVTIPVHTTHRPFRPSPSPRRHGSWKQKKSPLVKAWTNPSYKSSRDFEQHCVQKRAQFREERERAHRQEEPVEAHRTCKRPISHSIDNSSPLYRNRIAHLDVKLDALVLRLNTLSLEESNVLEDKLFAPLTEDNKVDNNVDITYCPAPDSTNNDTTPYAGVAETVQQPVDDVPQLMGESFWLQDTHDALDDIDLDSDDSSPPAVSEDMPLSPMLPNPVSHGAPSTPRPAVRQLASDDGTDADVEEEDEEDDVDVALNELLDQLTIPDTEDDSKDRRTKRSDVDQASPRLFASLPRGSRSEKPPASSLSAAPATPVSRKYPSTLLVDKVEDMMLLGTPVKSDSQHAISFEGIEHEQTLDDNDTPVVTKRRSRASENLIWNGIDARPCHRSKRPPRSAMALPYARDLRTAKSRPKTEDFDDIPTSLLTPARPRVNKMRRATSPERSLTDAPRKSKKASKVRWADEEEEEPLAAETDALPPIPAIDFTKLQLELSSHTATTSSDPDTSGSSLTSLEDCEELSFSSTSSQPVASESEVLSFLHSAIGDLPPVFV